MSTSEPWHDMERSELWAAVAAIGTMMAGLVAFIGFLREVVLAVWAWLATDETEPTSMMVTVGLVMIVFALFCIVVGPAWRTIQKWRAQKRLRALQGQPARWPRVLLVLIAIAGVAVAGVGLAGGPDKVLGLAHGLLPVSEEPAAKAEAPAAATAWSICTNARRANAALAGRAAPAGPTGTWTGTASWLTGEQRWTFSADRTLALTSGYPGNWRYANGVLTIGFRAGTLFDARLYGDVLCGVRLRPDGDKRSDGFFVLTRASPQAPPSEAPAPWPAEIFGNLL